MRSSSIFTEPVQEQTREVIVDDAGGKLSRRLFVLITGFFLNRAPTKLVVHEDDCQDGSEHRTYRDFRKILGMRAAACGGVGVGLMLGGGLHESVDSHILASSTAHAGVRRVIVQHAVGVVVHRGNGSGFGENRGRCWALQVHQRALQAHHHSVRSDRYGRRADDRQFAVHHVGSQRDRVP